jgi:hypothetical protein
MLLSSKSFEVGGDTLNSPRIESGRYKSKWNKIFKLVNGWGDKNYCAVFWIEELWFEKTGTFLNTNDMVWKCYYSIPH